MPTIKCTTISSYDHESCWTNEAIASTDAAHYPFVVDETKNPIDDQHDQLSAQRFYPSDQLNRNGANVNKGPKPETRFGVPTVVPDPPYHFRPFWNIGALVYFTKTGQRAIGTASFVASPNVLMTAAHMVIDPATGEWNEKFAFLRGVTYGSWAQMVLPETICIYEEFFDPSTRKTNPIYDYAFMTTKQKSGAGWLGFEVNTTFPEYVYSVGYPSCFGGVPYLKECIAPGRIPPYPQRPYYDVGHLANIPNQPNLVEMTQNPMQRGISGGPWIKNFDEQTSDGGKNMVIGLNSLPGPGGSRNSVTGPLFDEATANLLAHVLSHI